MGLRGGGMGGFYSLMGVVRGGEFGRWFEGYGRVISKPPVERALWCTRRD